MVVSFHGGLIPEWSHTEVDVYHGGLIPGLIP